MFEQRAIVVSPNEEECHRIALRYVVSSAVTVFVVSRNVPPRDFEPHSSIIIFHGLFKEPIIHQQSEYDLVFRAKFTYLRSPAQSYIFVVWFEFVALCFDHFIFWCVGCSLADSGQASQSRFSQHEKRMAQTC